jgi:hypothetical protein
MMRTVKRLFSIFLSVLLVAACAGGSKKPMLSGTDADLQQRDAFLLQHGMIYYGHDQQPGAFDDMYYAFVAGAKEMEEASAKASEEFAADIEKLSDEERLLLADVFNDYADLADLANYAYKDSKVDLPQGWNDLAEDDLALARIIDKHSMYGLKCSLMAKDSRRALVFAGTDFPGNWKNLKQVMNFIIDAYEDVNGALSEDASQVVRASALVDELIASGYVITDNLEFAGHSLGGRLSSEMAVRYGCPAVLFNAAGVSPKVYEQYEETRKSAGDDWRGYIVDVIAANDPLTCAQKYMSGSSDPFVSTAANALSVDKKTVENVLSLGAGMLEIVADNVSGGSKVMDVVKGLSDTYGSTVDKYYERDYRALGAMMPIREDMGGHGIKELAAALRARAELCASF